MFDRRTDRKIRKTFATKTAAKLWRQDALVAVRRGTVSPIGDTPTVTAALEDLVAGMQDGRILDRSGRAYRPATIRAYRQLADTYLKPALGARKLTGIHRRDVQALVEHLRAQGLKASTVVNILDPLRVICRRAVRDEILAIDPTKGLELPAQRGKRTPNVNVEHADRLLGALQPLERATYATFLYAGLRRGEAAALRVSDIDLTAGVVNVSRNLDPVEGEQDTKTDAGVRAVPIADALRRILAEWLLTSGRRGEDLAFGRTSTRPFVPSTLRSRAFAAWQHAGLEPLTPHEARHAAASFLLAAGVPLFEVSRYIGHTDVRTTANVYGHLVQGQEREAARRLDELLDRGREVS